jgi:hypothetical protein
VNAADSSNASSQYLPGRANAARHLLRHRVRHLVEIIG